MSKTFSAMQTNVGNMIRDTSSTTAVLIGVWLNDAYQDAWKRTLWSDVIDDDYTFESVVDQAEYSLESDFGEEVAVVDIANGHILIRKTIQNWWSEYSTKYSGDSLDSGNPQRYIILPESSTVKLDPPPDTAETYAMPYKKTVTDLSDTDTSLISNLDAYLEYKAISLGFAYKRKFNTSDSWLNKAEFELQKRIKQEEIKLNQKYQFVPSGRRVSGIFRLMGNKSYDQL